MEHFNELFEHAFKLSLLSVGIPLLSLFIVGLIISVLQAATQIQDQILSFFPKIGLCFLLICLVGSKFVELLSDMLIESIELSSQIE